MTELFLKLLNMGLSATWLILAVLLLRLVLKRAPKWVNPLLWGVAALRLVLPFSIESALSLIPRGEVISPEAVEYAARPAVNTNPRLVRADNLCRERSRAARGPDNHAGEPRGG